MNFKINLPVFHLGDKTRRKIVCTFPKNQNKQNNNKKHKPTNIGQQKELPGKPYDITHDNIDINMGQYKIPLHCKRSDNYTKEWLY